MLESGMPKYWQDSKTYLSEQDSKLAKIIANYSGEMLQSKGSSFFSLSRAIVGQQISVKAAESVWKKFECELGGEVTAQNITQALPENLRKCGLSGQKVLYLNELATFFIANPKIDWQQKTDDEVIKLLTSIKGIGKWSAQMFLMFHLLRPDIFPLADIGLQKAIEKTYNNGNKLTLKEMSQIAEQWQPYRTVATWYLWRSLDPLPVEY